MKSFADRFVPYQEQSPIVSTQWALGKEQQGFNRDWEFGNTPTAEKIAGGLFPDGLLSDPVNRQYQSLLVARAISERQTLNEIHVNLESGVGRWLKASQDLPYQEHSRVDAMKAALHATKVLDEQGQPRTVYHGTRSMFREFGKSSRQGLYGPGYYFTESLEEAKTYARIPVRMQGERITGDLPHVKKRKLLIQNPFDIEKAPLAEDVSAALGVAEHAGITVHPWRLEEYQTKSHKLYGLLEESFGGDKSQVNTWLKSRGYDAIRYNMGFRGQRLSHWIAFSPEQILTPGNIREASKFPVPALGRLAGDDPRVAALIAARNTLGETHVNLESPVGKFFKKLWNLPFKKHSRVDPIAAALWGGNKEGFERLRESINLKAFHQAASRLFKINRVPTTAEHQALQLWLGSHFRMINPTLRGEQVSYGFNTNIPETIQGLDTALASMETSRDLILYRGVTTLPGGEEINRLPLEKLVGRTVTDPGFQSTSLRYEAAVADFAVDNGYLLQIRASRGTHGFFFPSMEGREKDISSEFLLPRGASFRIANARVRNGRKELLVDLITGGEALPAEAAFPEKVYTGTRFLKMSPQDAFGYARPLGNRPHPLQEQWIEPSSIGVVRGGSIPTRIPVPKPIAPSEITPALLKEGIQTHHVNLESPIGKWVKKALRLPFLKHSRVDPLAASMQAFRTFQKAPNEFLRSAADYTAGQTAALTEYKTFGYKAINPMLRSGQTPVGVEARQQINILDELTHSGSVEKDLQVFRGFQNEKLSANWGNLVGSEFTEGAYASTSLNPYVAEMGFAQGKGSFTAEIRVPKGSHGFFYASHPTWSNPDKEAEFLLPRDTRFRVLEAHEAENAYSPRHLVLEAITPESKPTPLQLGQQVAREVRPTARAGASAARTMIAKGTLNELHQNLESPAGKFFKRVMRLPFMKRSRTDPEAAAQSAPDVLRNKSAVYEIRGVVESEAMQRFRPSLPAGVIPGSLLGSSIPTTAGNSSEASRSLSTAGTEPPRGGEEKVDERLTAIRRAPGKARVKTHIRLGDAKINMRQLDEGLKNFAKISIAYSRA